MMDPMNALVAAHPALFAGELPAIPSHLPAGWFGLVDRLCSDLEALLGHRSDSFIVAQVKEKFGSLRFYYDWNRGDAESDPHAALLAEQLRTLIDAAREQSTRICQKCGAPAVLASHRGWTAALCGQHASHRN